jgi:hypothetical protein
LALPHARRQRQEGSEVEDVAEPRAPASAGTTPAAIMAIVIIRGEVLVAAPVSAALFVRVFFYERYELFQFSFVEPNAARGRANIKLDAEAMDLAHRCTVNR